MAPKQVWYSSPLQNCCMWATWYTCEPPKVSAQSLKPFYSKCAHMSQPDLEFQNVKLANIGRYVLLGRKSIYYHQDLRNINTMDYRFLNISIIFRYLNDTIVCNAYILQPLKYSKRFFTSDSACFAFNCHITFSSEAGVFLGSTYT